MPHLLIYYLQVTFRRLVPVSRNVFPMENGITNHCHAQVPFLCDTFDYVKRIYSCGNTIDDQLYKYLYFVNISACPADSYNPENEPNICLPCGDNMSTQGLTGQVKEGCVCVLGWEGPVGGPCAGEHERFFEMKSQDPIILPAWQTGINVEVILIGLSIERPILDHHPKAHIHEIREIRWISP